MATESSGVPGPVEPDRNPAPGASGDAAPLLLWELSRVFTTRRWVFLSIASIVLAGVIAHTLTSVPIYRATSQVLIERQYQQLREFNDPLQVDTADVDYYNTQLKIIQGPGLADRVARLMNLSGRPQFKGGDPVAMLLGGLSVAVLKNNRVFEFSFEHPDRSFAAEVVNVYVKEYERDAVERRMKAINVLSGQMSEKLEDVKKVLDGAERKLMDFYQKHQLLLAEERQGGYQKLLDDLSVSIARQQDELKRLEAVGAQIEAAGDDITKLRSLEMVVIDSQAIRDMRLLEARAHEELAAASQKYREGHPLLREAQARAAEVSKKVEEEIRAIARGYLMQREAKRASVEDLRRNFEETRRLQMERDSLVVQADQYRRERDSSRTLYETLTLRIKESEISSGIEATNVHVLYSAEIPEAPARPDPVRNIGMGFLLAIFAGVAVTLVLERLDNRVRTPEEVEVPYGLPVLAVVPDRKPEEAAGPAALACWQEERSQFAEGYRQLRAAVLLSLREDREGGKLRTLMVASPGPGDGKTVSAVNLAISLAQTGEKTLFIDTDFHRSDSHKLFGLDVDKGLSTLLTSDIPFAQAVQPTPVPFLDFMSTGMIPPQPASLLGSARMKWVLEEASRHYTRIVIDTPPLAAVTDGAMLAPHVDALILVVRQSRTLKTSIRRAIQILSRIGVKPLGFVFNGLNVIFGDLYYKYHHPIYDLERGGAAARESSRSV